jgi:hypothetical protein
MFRYLEMRWRLRQVETEGQAKLQGIARGLADQNIPEALRRERSAAFATEFLAREEQIYKVHTNYLVSEAHRLVVPIPDRNDAALWTKSPVFFEDRLTARGVNELRAAIRAEKKARRESFVVWSSTITTVLSLLVAIAAIYLGRGK